MFRMAAAGRGRSLPVVIAAVVALLVLSQPRAAVAQWAFSSGALTVHVPYYSTRYSVNVDGQTWFESGPISFSKDGKVYSTADGTLKSIFTDGPSKGSDAFGPYEQFSMNLGTDGKTSDWRITFKAYKPQASFINSGQQRSVIVFQQEWLREANNSGASVFPSLIKANSAPVELGTLEYTGSSCGFMVSPRPDEKIFGGKSKGIVALVPRDTTGEGTNVSLVIGPVTEFFTNQAAYDKTLGALTYGLAGSFEYVPKGYILETALVASSAIVPSPGDQQPERTSMPKGGVNAALAEYGDFVLGRHSKNRSRADHNTQVEYIGYSTTGFYFYNLCDCLDPVPNIYTRNTCKNSPIPGCKSYADTLTAVHNALVAQGIPYQHMLLDSWWYGENFYGGAYEWEDIPAVVQNVSFPDGMAAWWKSTGQKAVWAHNGKWVSDTPYAKQYPFADDLPQGRELWDHLFSVNKQWGLETIKQDHMAQSMEAPSAWKNVSVLKSWLAGMGEAAQDHNVGVLYCCAPPNVHMNGVTVPSAFGVRASPDYVYQASGRVLRLPSVQWAIGPDSAFHWNAFGLLPYKDTFFSNTSASPKAGTWSKDPKQWVPFTGFYEHYPATHALMSTLSMAQVTFSDGVNETNKTLIMHICREDGKILKPDRPATAIDSQFQAMMFGSWPTPGPEPPSPGHGSLNVQPCDASNPYQQWNISANTISIQLSGGPACVDIARCSTDDGAAVDLFPNPAGCGRGPGTCAAKNELWSIKKSAIVAELDSLCLTSDEKGSRVTHCDASDVHQTWSVLPSSRPGLVLLSQGSDNSSCLTGSDIAPTPARQHGAIDSKSVPAATTPTSTSPSTTWWDALSPNYGKALRISDTFVRQYEQARDEADGQCCIAPQGPVGEVYTTHTTISNTTWYLAVGVQLSQPFALLPRHLVINRNATFFVTPWSETTTFKAVETPALFDQSHPINMNKQDDTGYHFQYYSIAPKLPASGWVLLGEAGKFVPVSKQRIVSVVESSDGVTVTLGGAPNENVEFGAFDANQPGSRPVYYACQCSTSGEAVVKFPGGCSA